MPAVPHWSLKWYASIIVPLQNGVIKTHVANREGWIWWYIRVSKVCFLLRNILELWMWNVKDIKSICTPASIKHFVMHELQHFSVSRLFCCYISLSLHRHSSSFSPREQAVAKKQRREPEYVLDMPPPSMLCDEFRTFFSGKCQRKSISSLLSFIFLSLLIPSLSLSVGFSLNIHQLLSLSLLGFLNSFFLGLKKWHHWSRRIW